MQCEIDVCQSILICAGVAEGNIFKPDFVFSVCFGFNMFAAVKFERFVIFKTFTDSGDVKGLLVQSIEASKNAGDPLGETAYCRKEQEKLCHAQIILDNKPDQVCIRNSIAQ